MNRKTPNIKLNFMYMMAYRVMVTISPLVTTPYISHILNPVDIGNYSFTQSISSYFSALAVLGCLTYGQREIAICRDDRYLCSKTFWEINIVRLITSLFVFVAYIIAIIFIFDPSLRIFYAILAIETFSGILDITWFYQGIENFSSVFKRNFIMRLLNIGLIFLVVKEQQDVYKYVAITALSLFVGNISLWANIRNNVDLIPFRELSPLKSFFPILLLFIPTIAGTLYSQLDITMLGNIGRNATENAYYAQGVKITTICSTTVSTICGVVAPRLAYTIAHGSKEQTNHYMSKALDIIFLVGMPMSVGVMTASSVLVPWFLGTEYMGTVKLMKWLSPVCFLSGLKGLFGSSYLIASRRQNKYTGILLVGVAANFFMNLLLIPKLMAEGASLASVVSELFVLAVILFSIRGELKFTHLIKNETKITVAAVLMGLIVYLLSGHMRIDTLGIIMLIIIGAFVYGFILLIVKEQNVELYKNKIINRLRRHRG